MGCGYLGGKVVLAMIAVLLPAAVLGSTTVDHPVPVPARAVGAAGLGLEGMVDDPPASRSSETTVLPPTSSSISTVPTAVPVATTAPRRTTTPSTTAMPAASGSTSSTLPPGPPATMPTTTIPRIPPVSSWSADKDGISVRMRMEPAEPAAGQPVSFFVEVSPVESCCIAHLMFGDGSATGLAVETSCSRPRSDMQKAVTSHTYAAAGVYKAVLIVATVPCGPPTFDGQPWIRGAEINACVVIGAPPTSKDGCAQ